MKHILVIDDEELVRTMLRDFLVAAGYRVSLASNGKQALDSFGQDAADLVISDIFMPEKDGLEVVMVMRQKWPTVPLVVMSGGGRMHFTDALRIAKTMGAARVLEKPIELENLLAVVHELLSPWHD